MTLGEKLAKIRVKNGMSQEEMAALLQVSRQSVSRWESDRSSPGARKLITICEYFHVSADSLLLDRD